MKLFERQWCRTNSKFFPFEHRYWSEIPEYNYNNSSYENVANLIIKLILKYRNHSDILAIGKVYREGRFNSFSISEVDKKEIFQEMLNLDTP